MNKKTSDAKIVSTFGTYLALVKARAFKMGIHAPDLDTVKDCFDAGKSSKFCVDAWIGVERVIHPHTTPMAQPAMSTLDQSPREKAFRKIVCRMNSEMYS